MTETPVLLVTWVRPDTTRRVLEQVAKARPATLIVASDGPAHDGQAGKIAETRALFNELPWECEVIREFSDFNMGLAWRVSSAIDFAFRQFDALIVLEDDIVADESFFKYCDELLEHHRDNRRVMALRGTSHRFLKEVPGPESYLFTRFMVPWGWATWRRAWTGFDHSFFSSRKARFLHRHPRIDRVRDALKQVPWWPRIRNDPALRRRLASCGDRYAFWLEMCDRQLRTRSWAGLFAMWLLECDGLVATPRVNLTENIGFREDAVHTVPGIEMPRPSSARQMPFPITHPECIELAGKLQKRIAIDTDRHWTDNRRLFFKRFRPDRQTR